MEINAEELRNVLNNVVKKREFLTCFSVTLDKEICDIMYPSTSELHSQNSLWFQFHKFPSFT